MSSEQITRLLISLSVSTSFDIAFQLVDIDDGFMVLMNDIGEQKSDVKLPDSDMGREIQAKFDNEEAFMVTILVSVCVWAV